MRSAEVVEPGIQTTVQDYPGRRGMLAQGFFPAGPMDGADATSLLVGAGAFAAKILVLATFLALVESSYAKLRFFRVPQYLGVGFVCALVALALRIL